MAKFCGKCGSPVDDKTGSCPHCDAPAHVGAKNKRKGSAAPILTAVILVIILAAAGTVYLLFSGKLSAIGRGENTAASSDTEQSGDVSGDEDNTDDTDDVIDLSSNYEVPEFDADEYYENNTELKKTISVRKSDTVSNEGDVYKLFNERGFDPDAVFYEYLIDGTYCGEQQISRYSSEEHPMYRCYYSSSDDSAWMITEANGELFAMYLSEDVTAPRLIVSESDTVTSYDSTTNKYYVNVPDSAQAQIKKVKTIEVETLDRLAKEVND